MKIKEIISQHRRDFVAIFICEHCNTEEKRGGYDDQYFHAAVIPAMVCKNCGKNFSVGYLPIATKYEDGKLI